jgi:hypothetical protein
MIPAILSHQNVPWPRIGCPQARWLMVGRLNRAENRKVYEELQDRHVRTASACCTTTLEAVTDSMQSDCTFDNGGRNNGLDTLEDRAQVPPITGKTFDTWRRRSECREMLLKRIALECDVRVFDGLRSRVSRSIKSVLSSDFHNAPSTTSASGIESRAQRGVGSTTLSVSQKNPKVL